MKWIRVYYPPTRMRVFLFSCHIVCIWLPWRSISMWAKAGRISSCSPMYISNVRVHETNSENVEKCQRLTGHYIHLCIADVSITTDFQTVIYGHLSISSEYRFTEQRMLLFYFVADLVTSSFQNHTPIDMPLRNRREEWPAGVLINC